MKNNEHSLRFKVSSPLKEINVNVTDKKFNKTPSCVNKGDTQD